ncbi:unnamed protein product [Bemisia tabaci]|uniref:Shugoshin C-terminal domain-containing protein n=1 Tax=Bemisia tabaci TaxID=7038 RepID=A0A9P0G5X8_BEMTA|nr:unnamed protein product [Bemisia tabaci]
MFAPNLYHKKLQKRIYKLLKKNRRICVAIKQIVKEDRDLHQKNENLVKELQKERLRSQTLHADLTYLQLENLQYMNTVGAIRAAQSSLGSEIPKLENRVRDLITDLINASSHLGPLQNSVGIIRHLTLDLQGQENSNNSISSPAPPRYVNAMGQKRMNLDIFPKNTGVALNPIEEVSQEISTTSPQVSAKKAPRYERKCKKGLRHLVSTRTSFRRRSSEISKEPSDQSNVCLSNTNNDEEGDRVVSNTNNDEEGDRVENFKSVHCEENSPKRSNKSDSGSSMELTPKVGNAGVSEDSTTPQSEESPLRSSRNSSSTLNPSSTPRKYSDVLKSAEKRNDGISPVSRSSNLESEPQQELSFSLPYSDIESTLQRITVRRGASHRKVLRAEPSFSGSYIPYSSTETPGNIVCKTEPVDELENSDVSKSAKSHSVKDTFSFYVFEPSSTLKAVEDNDENFTPIVNKGKKMKKTRKLKSTSSSCSMNRTSLMSANEVNIAANLYNSTPIESSKPQHIKRKPLATLASSTRIGSNDSAVSQGSNFINSDSVLSPILKSSTDQSTHNVTLVHSSSENSGSQNDSSQGRPRRNAAKNANYKEPSLNVKLRR